MSGRGRANPKPSATLRVSLSEQVKPERDTRTQSCTGGGLSFARFGIGSISHHTRRCFFLMGLSFSEVADRSGRHKSIRQLVRLRNYAALQSRAVWGVGDCK